MYSDVGFNFSSWTQTPLESLNTDLNRKKTGPIKPTYFFRIIIIMEMD